LLLRNFSLEEIIANLIALGIGMTVHEFAHNYVGHLMGDPVPAREGRLTLNPLVHINWIGWLMFAIIGFGVLGSAPISPERMRNPRWGYLAAVAAGPLSNLLIALLFAIPIRLLGSTLNDLPTFLVLLLVQIVYLNVVLFVFNLLPLFPIDGWHMVLALLPPDLAYSWQRHRQTTQYIFFGLLLLSLVPLPGLPSMFGLLVGQPAAAIARLLIGS
jgi:Zn-dependent protease